MNLKLLCSQVLQIVEQTGKYIKQQRENINSITIESKGLNDFVTNIDKESEKRLISFLKPLVIGAGFLAEENTEESKKAEYNWIIDPLDGTTNYIHGVSPYAISIALQHNNKTILGVVYEISLNEMFYAFEGSPAYKNNKPIHVSDKSHIRDSLIATGFPYNDFNHLDDHLDSLNYFMHHSHGIRRLGSAATDLVYVACGRFEVFYEYCLKPWDIAAGAFIVEKAGGKVCDFRGEKNYVSNGDIIATNAELHTEVVSKTQEFML